jgi:hypothetical protein
MRLDVDGGTVLIFGNQTIGRHLLRGALGIAALYISLSTLRGTTWVGFIFLAIAVYLLKGCPMCWTLGLIETIAMTIHRRSEGQFRSDGSHEQQMKHTVGVNA